MVCIGRLRGPIALGCSGSVTKQAPRLCSMIPVVSVAMPTPKCENSELIKRLMSFGGYKYIGEASATTSMRRYEQRGLGRMFWLWVKLWLQSFFGDLRHRAYETVR